MRRHPRRAEVDPHNPRGWGTSDRNGHIGNLHRMKWQFDWRGSHLINTRVLVHEDELDIPQRQLGTIVIPPDPIPLINARPENYSMDEQPTSTRYTIGPDGRPQSIRITLMPPGEVTLSNRIVTTPGNLFSGTVGVSGPFSPIILSVSPSSGPSGTVITITGEHFTGVTGVTIDGVAAAFTVVSDTTITATVP